MVCISLCPSTCKLSFHPGAPRLHPIPPIAFLPLPQHHAVPMDHSSPRVKPQPRNPQICKIPSPYRSTISDQLWDCTAVGCSMGVPRELGHPQTTETHSSFSFTPFQLAGECMVPGHTVAMTHTSAVRCFSIPCSFLYPLASSLDQVSCTPQTMGLKRYRGFRDLCTVPRFFLTGHDQGGNGRHGLAQGSPADCRHTYHRDCIPAVPPSVLPKVFSCCPHHFARQVLLGTGLASLLQWRVCLGPGNWKRVFFINDKLTVIVFSTAATHPQP